MNAQPLWLYCVITVNVGCVRWFLLRNNKTHYRTGEDIVRRVSHFKKYLVSAGRQPNQDNRIFTGVRPCTFPVVHGHVKVTETWRYIHSRFTKYRHDPGMLGLVLDNDNTSGERLGNRRIGNDCWHRLRGQWEYCRWMIGVCYLLTGCCHAIGDSQSNGK